MDVATNQQKGWILGIDTSVSGGSISLFSPSQNTFHKKNLPEGVRTSKLLLPEIARLLKEVNAKKTDLMAIGVARGPGSFTGLRIGLSTAKGLAFGMKSPLYGISSHDALAESVLRDGVKNDLSSPIWVLTYRDARHEEIFSALFGPCTFESHREFTCPRASDDKVCRPEETQLPENGTVLLTGVTSELPIQWKEDLGARAIMINLPSASGGVAHLTWKAIQRGQAPDSLDLQPSYGRKPRAETQWDE